MKLMIVESPNKTKKIQSALGAGWEVVASVGHVRDLPTKEMAVDRYRNNRNSVLLRQRPRHMALLRSSPTSSLARNAKAARYVRSRISAGFREGCNFAINGKVSGKQLTENQVKQLCHKGKADVLKGFMTKDKRPFEAALLLDTTTFKVIFSSMQLRHDHKDCRAVL
jgi:C-terminal repeat of topoisomerase/Toprim domain